MLVGFFQRSGRFVVARFVCRPGLLELVENQPRHHPTPKVNNNAKINVNAMATLMAMRKTRRATKANSTTKMTSRIATAVELKR